jgi:ribonuclease Y
LKINLKRLENLEKIALFFRWCFQKAYAVQAGRGIKNFVVPEKIDDLGSLNLAKQIATKIIMN